MTRIPIVSSDDELNGLIDQECSKFGRDFEPVFMKDGRKVVEHLKYELPEIKVFYCSDPSIDFQGIVKAIQEDPWLHYGGLIAVHDHEDEKKLSETLRDANVLAYIRKSDVSQSFARLLRILKANKQILFQRGIQSHLMKDIASTFVMDNDPFDITTYTNLITNYLYNANLISHDQKEKLHVALLEMLINGIEHGNCKIGFDEKTRWLEKGGDIMQLIREKNKDPAVRVKKVYLSYVISPERTRFHIRDEGDGFDWRGRMAKKLDPGLHGMGIKMTEIYIAGLGYNEKGNEVFFEVPHQRDESNVIPQIFSSQQEARFKDGEYVFREEEESDHLYYIVSGKLGVYSKNRLVSTLTPHDMFLGEMSFLLGNKRSATVVAKGECALMKISKNDFVNLIKENPHYGIFLARLLAQRLTRLNARTSRLNTEYLKLRDAARQ